MAVDTLEVQVNKLVGQLRPSQLAVVVQLLEVMTHDKDQAVTEEDRRRFREGRAWFAAHGGKGIPLEDVLAEYDARPRTFR